MKRRVGVLMGGLSSERPISMKTGTAVARALRERGHDVVEIDVGQNLPGELLAGGVQVAWIALHGRFGEDGCVQGLLEVMGIPYTGSGVLASAMAMDKVATKRALLHDSRVVLAGDAVIEKGMDTPDDMVFPVVVKPNVGGSTLGMHLAKNADELSIALGAAFELDPRVLVEEFVAGEEITVTVLDGEAFPAVHIQPDQGFFDFASKYTKGRTTYTCPAQLPQVTLDAASVAAVAAYDVLGCRGVARADFIVRADGTPVFLEINTIPGMTETSLVPMSVGAAGMSFGELCERILKTATRMQAEPSGTL